MDKKAFSIIGIVIGLALILGGIVLMKSGDSKGLEWSSSWRWDISVKDGIADPQVTNGEFMIEKDGDYTLHLAWKPDGVGEITESRLGFVTACTLTDDQKHLIFSASSLSGDFYPVLSLKKGNYHLVYRYLTNEEDFRSFAGTDNMEQYHFEDFQKDGTWKMEYGLHTSAEASFSATAVCALFGIIIGAALLTLALAAIVKKKGLMRQRYDERQELEQGRGFRYAFFAALVSGGTALVIDLMGLVPDRKMSVFYAGSLFIGIIVYVVYCIWHDCYIALNEKRGFVVALLGAIGIINLVIGISGICTNGWYDDKGNVHTTVLNLMCAVMCFVIAIAGLIRVLTNLRSSRAEGEDEE